MAQIEVIPGYQIADNEPLTYAKLRAMAQPTINLTTDLFNLFSSFKNGFINGNLQIWQRGTTPKTCSAGAKAWRADRWFVRPTGNSVTYERATSLPANAIAAYSAKITGNTSVTTVDFGQRIEATDAHSGWLRQRIFHAWIYNNTGATFTPKLRINTPSAADNYGTNANKLDVNLQACPNGGWTQVSCAFDGSTLENATNGIEIVVQIPDGALNNTGKSVYITQLQCEIGTVVTAQEPRLITHELLLCQRYCLRIDAPTASPVGQVLGFADDATNLPNKGILTLPTTMRTKPVFDGNNSSTADTVNDYFTVTAGSAGTPVISGYSANIVIAFANGAANWTPGAQVNITCTLTAEDRS